MLEADVPVTERLPGTEGAVVSEELAGLPNTRSSASPTLSVLADTEVTVNVACVTTRGENTTSVPTVASLARGPTETLVPSLNANTPPSTRSLALGRSKSCAPLITIGCAQTSLIQAPDL